MSTISTFVQEESQSSNESSKESAEPFKDEKNKTLRDDDIDTYYFESDHVALKGNQDYQALLKTLTLLQAQRVKAIQDLDQLYKCQQQALDDPIGFVDKLQHNQDLGIPRQQKISQIPVLDWEKYTSSVDFSYLGLPKHMTRLKKQLVEGNTDLNDQNAGPSGGQSDGLSVTLVRGRIKDESKPNTFNKLWTVEEQKRLEELLIKFPPEEVEAKRWQKIATALGNRTLQQVASRVQKYFIKLAKAGLPIPGRLPNIATYGKKAGHRHHRFGKFYQSQSTFLQSHEPPVFMSDDDMPDLYGEDMDNDDSRSSLPDDSTELSDDDETVPLEMRNTEEFRELLRLKSLRRQKLQDKMPTQHQGYKCDKCDCEPIVGTRWHCTDCPEDESLDLCDICVHSNFEIKKHNSSHRMTAIVNSNAGFVDSDYTSFMPQGYNYLDPNYMPAS